MSDWGKGSENNSIGYGQGAHLSTNGWGESHKTSYAGLTDIVGDPALGISYSASALCENASNPTPTVSGNEGSGTFSSTTGLVFVSTSTGEVNISSSTAGATYLITYTDTNTATATFSLTINNLDNAAFAYSASSYEPTGSDPTPTITGLTGGTFSSTSGLVFVDSGTNTGSSTGQIDLSATTIASYTITYDTTSSGSSVCPNTSTQTVEIALSGISNVYSMSFDGTNDYLSFDLEISNNTVTYSFWAKSSKTGYQTIIDFSPSGGSGKGLSVSSGGFNVEANIGGNTTPTIYRDASVVRTAGSGKGTSEFLSDGNWHHYIISGLTFGNGFTKAIIGAAHSTPPILYYQGEFDEIAIWNTALTSTQVSEIYSATGTNLTKDLTTVSGSNLKYWNRMGD